MDAILKPTHGVIIPTYNSGQLLQSTVSSVLKVCDAVIVVVDGSNDDSDKGLEELPQTSGRLWVIRLAVNSGKGGAFLEGARLAITLGWTHAVAFDSDGQHDEADIPRFIQVSKKHPHAMVLGLPIFGEDAPTLRVIGRQVGNWWTQLETLWGGVGDSLFGFRVYPLRDSVAILESIRWGRRYDFDTQLVVRLYWRGYHPINLRTRVRYPARNAGGISHFNYLRDNLLLIAAHISLVLQAIVRLPELVRLRNGEKNE
jgi:glycosyltransferase involved in cell wall biosynthesis